MGPSPRARAYALGMFALLGLSWSSLSATTVVALDADTLIQKSRLIVQAVCSGYRCYRDDTQRIVTRYTFSILETLKGTERATLSFVQPGGVYQGIATVIPGLSSHAPGQESVLFLGPGGAYRLPVGLDQGVFRVVVDPQNGRLWVRRSLAGLHLLPSSGDPLPDHVTLEEFKGIVRAGIARTQKK